MDLHETHALRDGRELTLRAPSVKDAEQIVSLDEAIVEAGQGIVLDPSQVRVLDEARRHIDNFCRDASAGSASIVLVAEIAGSEPRIAASTELRQLVPALCSHVAVLSIGVHPRYQRLGHGRFLMLACSPRPLVRPHAGARPLVRPHAPGALRPGRQRARKRSTARSASRTRERAHASSAGASGEYVDDHIFALFS